MADNYNTQTINSLAEKLEKSFPNADLIAVTNEQLFDMIKNVGENFHTDNIFVYSLKSKWAEIRENGEQDYNPEESLL